MMMRNNFLSVHLYYSGNLNLFLGESLSTFVAKQTNEVDSFFFIRYWDRGPHIRLRIKTHPSCTPTISQKVEQHFQRYFDLNPSFRIEPNYPVAFPKELRWIPNDSIHYEVYQPELDRYGGNQGISLAEQHFNISSNVALKLIQFINEQDIEYEQILNLVIPYQLSFVIALGLEKEALILFFKCYFNIWKKRNIDIDYEATYQAVKNNIDENIVFIKQVLQENKDFEDQILNMWMEKNRFFINAFKEAAISVHEPHPANHYLLASGISKKWDTSRWSMYIDFLHLFNNRLGINTKDESLIAYIIYRSLENTA